MAELAYNNSVNRTERLPFEVVVGIKPRLPIDLIPLPIEASQEAEDFARHMKDVHDKVHKLIAKSNEL